SAGVVPSAKPADVDVAGPASRFSFELSNVPETPQRADPPASGERVATPVPTARVIARADPDPAPREATPASRTKPRTERAEADKPASAPGTPDIQKQVKQPTAREQAENEYRKAVALLNQGRMTEAQ